MDHDDATDVIDKVRQIAEFNRTAHFTIVRDAVGSA
jgi:hypothetical protein